MRIRGLFKHFGSGEQRVQALRGIDWDVYAGQMTLIVGPSGCGKTTLLSVIAGILDCDCGRSEHLRPRDDDDERPRADSISARNIGFVFQQYNLLPALSAAENAAIPLVIAGWPKERAVSSAAECWRRWAWASKLYEPAQQALGRSDAAGGHRPRHRARAAPPGVRRTDRRARPRDRASRSWSWCARRPFDPTGPWSSSRTTIACSTSATGSPTWTTAPLSASTMGPRDRSVAISQFDDSPSSFVRCES